jgi:hypothetical protein
MDHPPEKLILSLLPYHSKSKYKALGEFQHL